MNSFFESVYARHTALLKDLLSYPETCVNFEVTSQTTTV